MSHGKKSLMSQKSLTGKEISWVKTLTGKIVSQVKNVSRVKQISRLKIKKVSREVFRVKKVSWLEKS